MRRILLTIMILLFLVSCSGKESIEFDHNIETDGKSIIITGETNLVNESLINYEITNYDVGEILTDGNLEVTDGEFHKEIDTSDFPAGEFEVYIGFFPYSQSDDIQEIYGSKGENMKLNSVVNYFEYNDEIRVIEASKTFDKN